MLFNEGWWQGGRAGGVALFLRGGHLMGGISFDRRGSFKKSWNWGVPLPPAMGNPEPNRKRWGGRLLDVIKHLPHKVFLL